MCRQPGTGGQVGATGQQHAVRRGHLVGALVQGDADQPVPQRTTGAVTPDRVGDRGGPAGQLPVGERAGAGDDGRPIRLFGGTGEERLVQQAVGQGTGGPVHLVAFDELIAGRRDAQLAVPCRAVGREPFHQLAVRGEHVVEQVRREQLLDDVPGQVQRTGDVDDLVVEPDLRCLADPIGDVTEVVARPGDVGDRAQSAGEHDRHGAERGVQPEPAPFPHRVQRADMAMPEILLELALGAPDALVERALGGIDLE